MYNILALIGEAGSGKDTILRKLIDDTKTLKSVFVSKTILFVNLDKKFYFKNIYSSFN